MKFNLGIIGYGGMGRHHQKHIDAQIENVTVKGIYDIKPQQCEAAKEAGLFVYDSARALILDEDIDIVLVSTPNNFHKDYSIAALEAGKNVICEKPVMMNSGELLEVMEVAKKTGKLFTIHQNRRWDRDFLLVKRALADNTIGTPFFIESRVEGARGIPGDWRCTKVAGGGMMLDWGVHLIDQLLWLIDSPVSEIYAQVLNVKYEEVDDNLKINMRFENGICGLIEIGTYHFITLPRWHICGDKGTLEIKDWSSGAEIVRANTIEMNWEQGIVYTAAGPTRTMAPRPREATEQMHIPIDENTSVHQFYENVCAAIEDKAELIVTAEQALRSTLVMEAAFKSSAEGICVKGPI